jgi:hypothetical protein
VKKKSKEDSGLSEKEIEAKTHEDAMKVLEEHTKTSLLIDAIYVHKRMRDEASIVKDTGILSTHESLAEVVLSWLLVSNGNDLTLALNAGRELYFNLYVYSIQDAKIKIFLEFLQEKRPMNALNFYIYLLESLKMTHFGIDFPPPASPSENHYICMFKANILIRTISRELKLEQPLEVLTVEKVFILGFCVAYMHILCIYLIPMFRVQ